MRRLLLRRMRRSLWRIRLRVVMILFLIILATWLSAMMSEHVRNADRVYEDIYEETNLGDVFADSRGVMYNTTAFKEACNAIISNASKHGFEVRHCESRLSFSGFFLDADSQWSNARFHGFEESEVNQVYLTDGEWSNEEGEVVIDDHIADDLDIEVGDAISVMAGSDKVNLTISGIAVSPEHLFYVPEGGIFPAKGDYAVFYMDVSWLTELSGMDPQSRNRLLIDLEGTPDYDLQDTTEDEGEELAPLKEMVLEALGSEGIDNIQVGDRGSIYSVELLRQDLEGARKSLPLITVVLAAVSGLVIAISMDRMVRTQNREIAVLRTLGIPRKQILIDYMMAPLFLGVTGASLGLLIGISPYGSEFMTAWYFEFFGIPIVHINHYPDLLLSIWAGVVAIVLIFGFRPAWKASRMMPLEAMRDSATVKPNRMLSRLTARLPTTMGLGIRSTFRRPGRLMVTILALGLALIITGSMMLMMASMEKLFGDDFEDQNRWDSEVSYPPWSHDSVVDWLDDSDVSHYQFASRYFANASGDERPFQILGIAAFNNSDDVFRKVMLTSGEYPREGAVVPQVLIDEGMSIHLGWSIGDEHEVVFGSSKTTVEIVGTTNDLARTMTMYQSDLETGIGMGSNLVWMKHDADVVDDELRALSWSVMSKQEMMDGFDELKKTQEQMLVSVLWVGWGIAIAILLNTLMINLSERDTELATLRILGASRWNLAGLLTLEHAIIGLLGGLVGAISSVLLAVYMVQQFSTWVFHMPMDVDWGIVAQIIMFVLIAALATTPIGSWRIGRMDLVEHSKGEG